MKRRKIKSIAIDAYFDNFTCAAIFGRLRIPGAPRKIVDSRPADIFWMDELRYILEDVKKIVRIAQVTALGGIIFESISEGLITSAIPESFKSRFTSIKLQTNAHQPQ